MAYKKVVFHIDYQFYDLFAHNITSGPNVCYPRRLKLYLRWRALSINKNGDGRNTVLQYINFF